MLSDCLNNYIGLRGYCSDTTPESGLYVNDLPAISLKMLASISNEEQKNFSGIWNEIYSRSLNELESDVLIEAQSFFKTTLVAENNNTGYYADPYNVSTSSNELKGTTIEVDSRTSRYLSIYVNSVQLYLPTAVNDNIYIYNLMNGELLDTIAFTGSIGVNTIQINKKYISYGQDTKIFICYNSNDVGNSIDTTSVDDSSVGFTRGAKISTASQVILDNLTLGGDSYGLIANYNLNCDISEFICTSKDVFKYALWWKLGASIQFERLTTDRLNKYTLIKNTEEINALWSEYDDKYRKIIKAVVSNLRSSSDRVCFSCSRQRNYKYLTP